MFKFNQDLYGFLTDILSNNMQIIENKTQEYLYIAYYPNHKVLYILP